MDVRPNFDPALEKLLVALCRDLEPLRGLQASQVLPVAVSAHGTASASVRSLDDVADGVAIQRRSRRWELALRPVFFLDGDPLRRLATLCHELLHLDPVHPGRLLEERRHRRRTHEAHEQEARALARQFAARGEVELLAPLGHHGEILVRHWRVRPISSTSARKFTTRDVFAAPVVMRTAASRRSVWW